MEESREPAVICATGVKQKTTGGVTRIRVIGNLMEASKFSGKSTWNMLHQSTRLFFIFLFLSLLYKNKINKIKPK